LKTKDVIDILVFELVTFLPIFEKHHPNVTWPRDFIFQFLKIPLKDRVYDFPFYKENYSSPGSNGFLQALGFLADIDRSQNNPDRYTFSLAVEAISAAIESKKLALWAMEHPNEWEEWIVTNNKPMQLESATADEGASNSWLSIADKLEKRFHSGEGSVKTLV
jgi:hypothetical protein